MKRTIQMTLTALAVLTSLGAVASADLFDGMPTGSIMDTYAQLMGQTPYGFNGGCLSGFGGSLLEGMPTRTFADDYAYYYNQVYNLWAATGFGSLAGLGEMNSAWQNANDARSYWGNKWDREYLRGDIPIYENNGAHITVYPDGLMGY